MEDVDRRARVVQRTVAGRGARAQCTGQRRQLQVWDFVADQAARESHGAHDRVPGRRIAVARQVRCEEARVE